MFLERPANVHRALRRRFWVGVKCQQHPVAGWDPSQTARSFGSLKLLGRANNPVQFLKRRMLVANRQLGVTDDVDEKDMRDFERDLVLNFSDHVHFGAVATSFWKRGSFRSGSNIGSSRSSAGVSGMYLSSAPVPGIESTCCKAAMARSGSPVCAATRARVSIGAAPFAASFSIGSAAIPRSERARAAALSPRPILVNARAPMRPEFSGCSLRKDSSSLRAWRQLSWAAA